MWVEPPPVIGLSICKRTPLNRQTINNRPTVGRRSTDSWPTVGRLLVDCWPSFFHNTHPPFVGWQSAKCWQTVGDLPISCFFQNLLKLAYFVQNWIVKCTSNYKPAEYCIEMNFFDIWPNKRNKWDNRDGAQNSVNSLILSDVFADFTVPGCLGNVHTKRDIFKTGFFFTRIRLDGTLTPAPRESG